MQKLPLLRVSRIALGEGATLKVRRSGLSTLVTGITSCGERVPFPESERRTGNTALGQQLTIECSRRNDASMRGLLKYVGLAGFILSVGSLCWQIRTYRESFEEKATVRLTADFPFHPNDPRQIGDENKYPFGRKVGNLSVEVVNLGQRPLYVRVINLTAPCPYVQDTSESRPF